MEDSAGKANDRIEQLVARAREGDLRAFDTLFRMYETALRATVDKRLGPRLRSKMESVDLVQSVWKDVLRDMKDFNYQGPDSFFNWLAFRIVRKINDKGRYFATGKRNPEKERRIFSAASRLDSAMPLAANDPSPSEAAMADEDLDRLMRLLGGLPDLQRQALVLRLRDNLSCREIGKIMGRSAGAVQKLCNRALKKIDETKGKDQDSTES